MIQTKRKLLSGVLAAALLLQTALPTAVFAAEPAAKTIVGFSALEQSDYTLPIGADETEVVELLATFPETITAEVEYIVTEEVTQPPVVDSGKPETLPPEDTVEAKLPLSDNSSKSDTEESAAVLNSGEGGNSTEQPEIATEGNADEQEPSDDVESLPYNNQPDTSLVQKVVSEQVELSVTWESGKPLATERAGTFTYTAVLSDTDKGRYDLATGVSLPKLTVTVAEPLAMMSPRSGYTYDLSLGSITIEAGTDSDTHKVTHSSGTVEDNIPKDTILTITSGGSTTANTITVTGGTHNITLSGVTIASSAAPLALSNNAKVTLALAGSNSLTATAGTGISVPTGTTLEITGEGSLEAIGGSDSPGIGSESVVGCGVIAISGGTVTATGGTEAAGIGSSKNSPSGGSITISGGTVTATGGAEGGAGIGGGRVNTTSGVVTISGGTVTANGIAGGAGIGGGYGGRGGTVTISGGTVIANGSTDATNPTVIGAGIGAGATNAFASTFTTGTNGNAFIKASSISDASYKTTSGTQGVIFEGTAGTVYGSPSLSKNAVIEADETLAVPADATLTIPTDVTLQNNGTIVLNGGTINGTVSGNQPVNMGELNIANGSIEIDSSGYKVGGGSQTSYIGDYIITGGGSTTANTITVTGGTQNITLSDVTIASSAAPLALSGNAKVTLTLAGSNSLTATAGAGIYVPKDTTLEITGEGSLEATGSDNFPGIGGNSNSQCGTINISGGTVTANGGIKGAGIGSGSSVSDHYGDGATITISGGTVTANGGIGGAGIGGGTNNDDGGVITISGGTVTANGSTSTIVSKYSGAGIGAGSFGGSVTFTTGTSGSAFIKATSKAASISDSTYKTAGSTQGIIFEGIAGTVYGSSTLSQNAAIVVVETLTVPAGATLTIPAGVTLQNSGTLLLDGGAVAGAGTLSGSGAFRRTITAAADIAAIPDQVYTGSAIEPAVSFTDNTYLAQKFTGVSDGYTKSYESNTNVGTAKVVFTKNSDSTLKIEKAFNITQSGTVFEGGVAADKTNYGYGDIITVTAKPKATGKAPAVAGRAAVPSANQMALYVKVNGADVQISSPATADANGVYTMTCTANTDNHFDVNGTTQIIAKYVGNNMANAEGSVTVTVTADATVTKNGVTTYHATLQGATDDIGAIGAGETGTVTLLKDVNLEQKLALITTSNDPKITLNLNGKTLSSADTSTISVNMASPGLFTIQDTAGGGILQNTAVGGSVIFLSGTLVMEGGTLICGNKGNGIVLKFSDGSSFTMTGGVIDARAGWNGIYKEYNASKPTSDTILIDGGVIFGGTETPTDNGMSPHQAIYNQNPALTLTINKGLIWGVCMMPYQNSTVAVLTEDSWTCTGSMTLPVDAEIPGSAIFTVREGATLTIPTDVTLQNSGTLLLDGGTVAGAGILSGSGKFRRTLSAVSEIVAIPDQVYTGRAIEPVVTFTNNTIMAQTFTAFPHGYIRSYESNTNVGTAKVVFTKNSDPTVKIEKEFNITQSGTTFDGGATADKAAYTYGDIITVTAKPKATGKAPAVAGRAAPIANQMALYAGTKQISEPATADANGVYNMIYNTSKKEIATGSGKIITAKYIGTANMADYSADVTFTLNPKTITAAAVSAGAAKTYDSTTAFSNVALTPNASDLISGDVVTATASGTVADANVGTAKAFTATAVTLGGAQSSYYSLAATAVSGNVAITKAAATGIAQTFNFAENLAKPDYTYDLSKLLPGVTPPASLGTVTYSTTAGAGAVLSGSATISGSTITLPVKAVAKNTTQNITISITSSNYTIANVTLTLTAVDKLPLNIAASITGRAYNGKALAYTGTPVFTKTTDGTVVTGVTYQVEYEGVAPTVYVKNTTAPTIAGAYKATITVDGDSAKIYMGRVDVAFTISKAALTVKADDKSAIIGGEKPTYTATTTGLVNGETISGITFTDDNAVTTAKGSFTITPAGGTISGGGNANYEITYQTGTLTVNIDVTVIDAAIAAANSAKNGIIISNQPAFSVPKGTKFVTTAEMNALNSAISTATAAKAKVNTATEAQAAATALNDAVVTFTAAIKIGTYTSGGGGSGGGSSSSGNTTVTTPPATTENPNPPTQGSVTVPPTISGDTATVTVPTATVKDAISKALAEAKKNGKTENGISVEIKANTKNATNLTANLPKASIDALVSAGIKEAKITSGVATISLSLNTLKELQKQAGTDVTVTATKVANSALSNEAKALVGNRPVYDLRITSKNGVKVTSFGNGTVSVSIPYTLGANETAGNVVAYYIDGTGKATEMPNSVYNTETKTLSFVTSHFSLYAVGYKAKTATFTDIANHPAKDSIEFVAARGLLAGTGEGKFSPNTSMTRGMFVTALGRLAGADVSSYKQSSFTDVNAGTIILATLSGL